MHRNTGGSRRKGVSRRGGAGSGILIALLLACLLPAAMAMPAESPDVNPEGAADPTTETQTAAPSADPDNALADWLDGFIQAQRRSERIPGAAVALVRSDGPILLRGWGWSRADATGRQPVNPRQTLFRIGSVTKTFTWTAVMDAIVSGRLDPDADVNQWLDELEIPVRDGRPVTLFDLMSHSAGFEDRVTGLLAPSPGAVQPLERWLAEAQPEQVYPPGQLPAYSNYGTALAARVLEQADGRDWATILRADLLEPLGMDRTLAEQWIPERLEEDLARGHHFAGGQRLETPFWTIRAAPAGAMTSTAADMARWLQLHLNEGVVDDRRILRAATVARMQTPLRGFHPEVPPLLHGFYRMDRDGETILGHSGSLGDMVSLMALFPERDLGLFVVYNAAVEGAPVELLEGLVTRLRGDALPDAGPSPEDFDQRAARYLGEYVSTRRNHSTIEKAAGLVGGVEVTTDGEGHLLTRFAADEVRQWVELTPDRFRERDGSARLAFSRTGDGSMRMWLSTLPVAAFDQRQGLAAPSLHRAAFAVTTTIFLLALLGWPAATMRNGQQMVFGREPHLPAGRVTLAWCTALLGLTGMVLLALAISEGRAFLQGVPQMAELAVWTHAAFLPLAIATLILALASYLDDAGSGATAGQRLGLLVVAVAAGVHLVLLWWWNLMPWHLP